MSIDYSERIPNNVDLAEDRRLQRALESWQPGSRSGGERWAHHADPGVGGYLRPRWMGCWKMVSRCERGWV